MTKQYPYTIFKLFELPTLKQIEALEIGTLDLGILRGSLKMGIQVHTNKNTSLIQGNGKMTGMIFSDTTTLDAEMLVVSAGYSTAG